jgi:hypothetical protein
VRVEKAKLAVGTLIVAYPGTHPRAAHHVCRGSAGTKLDYALCRPHFSDVWLGVEEALEEQAINDALRDYQMPATERSRLLSHGRNELRASLFRRLCKLIRKASPTPVEQQALAHFANRIKQKRIEATTLALEEYLRWKENPCIYGPPPPFEYDPSLACYRNSQGFLLTGGPQPPSFEEFVQIGVMKAYRDFNGAGVKVVTEETARSLIVNSGIDTTLEDIDWSILAYGDLASVVIVNSILAGSFAGVATAGAAGTAGVAGAAGPIAAVLFLLITAVSRTIDVVNASQIQGKLETAKAEAQNATIDLEQILSDDTGLAEVYGAFLLSTLPDFPDSSVPPPTDFDRQFLIRDHNATTTTNSPTISYRDWDGNCHTARQSGSWFVDRDQNGVEKLTLSINCLNWNSDKMIITRSGLQFIPTKAGVGIFARRVDEIQYQDCNLMSKAARIKFDHLTVTGNPLVTVGCPLIADAPQAAVIGLVAGSGDSPPSLEVTVNDQPGATVNGITVRDLAINQPVNGPYQITANVFVPANTPVTSDFTVKVKNTIGQISSAPFTVKKTAIAIPLPDKIPGTANLGSPYHAQLREDLFFISCGQGNGTISITAGALPHGLSLQPVGQFGLAITGTPTAGGVYQFTVAEALSNGEQQSRTYTIFVNSNLVDMPSGLVSWWRGEGNVNDFTDRHKGSLFGSAGFAYGFVNAAFKFDGTNGYVALPNDTFDPSLDFTYELWFKTNNPGVILGRQRGVAPYNTPLQGTRAPIYVGNDGKLHVRMFGGDGENFISSPSRVDNNAFHHVAVTYNRVAQTEQVYLNGTLIGSINGLAQGNDPSFIYQLGTGYVSDSGLNMFGWFNFNGLIDEATLYDRALTTNEIRNIYTAGGAGKISVKPIAMPPSAHNGADGGIAVLAQGGIPPLRFSKDNGATFQETNTFYDLSPGTYNVVIKDATAHTITKAVTINNPSPTLSLAALFTNPTCTFSQTGRITLVASGATGPVEYSVLNGANHQPSNIFEGLSAGTYTPWVRDENTGTVFVGEPIVLTDPPQLTLSPATVPAAIVGQPYAVTFTSNGGTGARSISAINLAPWMTATSTASGLTISGTPPQAGNFPIFVKVEDANNCLTGRNVIINAGTPCATPPIIGSCSPGRTASGDGNCQAAVPDFRADRDLCGERCGWQPIRPLFIHGDRKRHAAADLCEFGKSNDTDIKWTMLGGRDLYGACGQR